MSSVTGEIGYKVNARASQSPFIGIVVEPSNSNIGQLITRTTGTYTGAALTVLVPGGAGLNTAIFPVVISNIQSGGTGIGVYNGLQIVAGTGAADNPLLVLQGGGTGTFLQLLGNGAANLGWNNQGLASLVLANSGGATVNGNTLAVKSATGATTYFNVGNGGCVIENIVGGSVPLRVYENASASNPLFQVSPPASILGTSTTYAWGTGTSYPILQVAGLGALASINGTNLAMLGGGLYYNGTNYIYGQAGTGILMSMGTGTLYIQAVNTSGTAAGTATPFTVMSVSGSATLGGVVLGTGTLLPWGGGAALASVLQLGETGGIYSNNQTTLILSGCYNNGTNYQFSGTGGGTSTAGLLTIGGPGNAGGAIMAFYCGGVGTYTQQVTFTQVFQVGGTVATAVVTGYGTRAAALVDMTPDLGTFTGTWGGGITAPINTAGYWARTGNTVTILIPYGTASKSGAAGNITFAIGGFGVPLPVKTHLLTTPVCINGATTSVGVAQVTNNGTFTFQGLGGAAFVGTANWSIGITGDFTALSYTIGP